MHKVISNQTLRIVTLKIAFNPVSEGEIADEMSSLLTENGIMNEESHIVDWGYIDGFITAFASNDYEENEFLKY